jgi:hypothetical protein
LDNVSLYLLAENNESTLAVILEIKKYKYTGKSMPYVSRSIAGAIIELHDVPPGGDSQWLEITDPEVINFLQLMRTPEKVNHKLSSTDYEMVRVIEDLVDLLIEKQVFIFTELPEAVQEKLSARKHFRKDMQSLNNLISGDEDIFC